MLFYPKIPGSHECPTGRCVAFEKYDGTNLHWCWDREHGWHAFGTRRERYQLLPDDESRFAAEHPELGEAPEVFRRDVAGAVDAILRGNESFGTVGEATIFTEFLGPNSFAGRHVGDDTKELRLFDVQLDPGERTEHEGFVGPEAFVQEFGHLPFAARVIYCGPLTGRFADDVREGRYDVAEGVVCKGTAGRERWVVKIKTNAYLARLKQAFADRWEDHWE